MKSVCLSCVIVFATVSCGFADVLTYNCSFSVMVNRDGIPNSGKGLTLTFVWDTLTSDAFIQGNNGAANVFPITGERAITFIEVLGSGAIQSTTVNLSGDAVHSRHTLIADKFSASQNYGTCSHSVN